MILYSLKSFSLQMDVYEDKVIFYPRLWKTLAGKKWESAKVIHYSTLTHVELQKKLWPANHLLVFHTANETVEFGFRKLYPFFERLKLYFDRQIINYYNRPHKERPLKSVIDLVKEKQQKAAQKDRLRAA